MCGRIHYREVEGLVSVESLPQRVSLVCERWTCSEGNSRCNPCTLAMLMYGRVKV